MSKVAVVLLRHEKLFESLVFLSDDIFIALRNELGEDSIGFLMMNIMALLLQFLTMLIFAFPLLTLGAIMIFSSCCFCVLPFFDTDVAAPNDTAGSSCSRCSC